MSWRWVLGPLVIVVAASCGGSDRPARPALTVEQSCRDAARRTASGGTLTLAQRQAVLARLEPGAYKRAYERFAAALERGDPDAAAVEAERLVTICFSRGVKIPTPI